MKLLNKLRELIIIESLWIIELNIVWSAKTYRKHKSKGFKN